MLFLTVLTSYLTFALSFLFCSTNIQTKDDIANVKFVKTFPPKKNFAQLIDNSSDIEEIIDDNIFGTDTDSGYEKPDKSKRRSETSERSARSSEVSGNKRYSETSQIGTVTLEEFEIADAKKLPTKISANKKIRKKRDITNSSKNGIRRIRIQSEESSDESGVRSVRSSRFSQLSSVTVTFDEEEEVKVENLPMQDKEPETVFENDKRDLTLAKRTSQQSVNIVTSSSAAKLPDKYPENVPEKRPESGRNSQIELKILGPLHQSGSARNSVTSHSNLSVNSTPETKLPPVKPVKSDYSIVVFNNLNDNNNPDKVRSLHSGTTLTEISEGTTLTGVLERPGSSFVDLSEPSNLTQTPRSGHPAKVTKWKVTKQ